MPAGRVVRVLDRVAEERGEVRESDENMLAVDDVEEGLPQCLDERQDHHRRVDDDGRGEEDEDMPAPRSPPRGSRALFG